MKKYYGNMLSWTSVFINILCLILIMTKTINMNYILITVLFAVFLDMFDGKLARKYVDEPKDFIFGELTDSLCDIINFGFIPTLTFIKLYTVPGIEIIEIIIIFLTSCIFLWSGLFRLARFSRDKTKRKVDYFQGIPITIGGAIALLFILLLVNNLILSSIILMLISYLMASSIKIKKI